MNIEDTLNEILKRLDKIEEQTPRTVNIPHMVYDWVCSCEDEPDSDCPVHTLRRHNDPLGAYLIL